MALSARRLPAPDATGLLGQAFHGHDTLLVHVGHRRDAGDHAFATDQTMQAPHLPSPQPHFVPVSFKSSRSTSSKGRWGSVVTVAGRPFTVNVKVLSICVSQFAGALLSR